MGGVHSGMHPCWSLSTGVLGGGGGGVQGECKKLRLI